jgi:hypothetical protein
MLVLSVYALVAVWNDTHEGITQHAWDSYVFFMIEIMPPSRNEGYSSY